MATATDSTTSLAYDDEGAGTPVVFLHGLTFDRRTWRPIIERLHGGVRSIAIDLPAHGDSGGVPVQHDEFTAQLYRLLGSLEVDRPIVVGHSMSGGLASFYAANHPSRGLVSIDNGPDIDLRPARPTARACAVRPGLRPGVADVRGQPRTRTHRRAHALARARSTRGETRRCRRLLADRAAHRPGRIPGVDRRPDPSARRAVPRRFRATDHPQRTRTVRMDARRTTRGMDRRRPLRPPRRPRSLRHSGSASSSTTANDRN